MGWSPYKKADFLDKPTKIALIKQNYFLPGYSYPKIESKIATTNIRINARIIQPRTVE